MSEAKQEFDPHHPFPGEAIEASKAVTPMELLQMAMNQNADISKLEKLMELQLRWEANEAAKAFAAGMAAFKANPPEIVKNHRVAYEARGQKVAYTHATLDAVCDAVTEGLSKQGITHRWKVEQKDGRIRVTCVLKLGIHTEETTLESSPDDTGSKNAIQALGSAVTYLQRYTLLAATGLAAKNGDDDGQGAPKMETLQIHLDRITDAPNHTALENAYKDAFKEAFTLKNTQAMQAIVAAKDARKKKLDEDQPA